MMVITTVGSMSVPVSIYWLIALFAVDKPGQ